MITLVLAFLYGYKRWISPALPGACRFSPTCSEYAIQAFARHGLWRASWLTLGRLLRCNPLSRGGLDLVPESEILSGCNRLHNQNASTVGIIERNS